MGKGRCDIKFDTIKRIVAAALGIFMVLVGCLMFISSSWADRERWVAIGIFIFGIQCFIYTAKGEKAKKVSKYIVDYSFGILKPIFQKKKQASSPVCGEHKTKDIFR
jgi:hypothetical protein